MSNREEDENPGEDVTEPARLTEEITRRLEAGEPVDAADFVGEDPACAGSIRQLLPTLRTMVALGELLAREEGLRGPVAEEGQKEAIMTLGYEP